MRIWLTLVLILTGCANVNERAVIQQTLDGYAQAAAKGAQLEEFLSGEALTSARQSAALMSDLGFTQLGMANFEIATVGEGEVSGCLDLSGVQVVDSQGALVQPNRTDRLQFTGRFGEDARLYKLEVLGPC
ncbi:MAG: hypothetical protein VW008_01570 [Aquiluna sp.]